MAEQKQDDQLEHTYNRCVRIRDVALKTCQRGMNDREKWREKVRKKEKKKERERERERDRERIKYTDYNILVLLEQHFHPNSFIFLQSSPAKKESEKIKANIH